MSFQITGLFQIGDGVQEDNDPRMARYTISLPVCGEGASDVVGKICHYAGTTSQFENATVIHIVAKAWAKPNDILLEAISFEPCPGDPTDNFYFNAYPDIQTTYAFVVGWCRGPPIDFSSLAD